VGDVNGVVCGDPVADDVAAADAVGVLAAAAVECDNAYHVHPSHALISN
jgi:hypothetical protein